MNLQYVNFCLELTFIFFFARKFHRLESRIENITQFLHSEKEAAEERKRDYENDLSARLDTLQKMRFSPLRIVTKRD